MDLHEKSVHLPLVFLPFYVIDELQSGGNDILLVIASVINSVCVYFIGDINLV